MTAFVQSITYGGIILMVFSSLSFLYGFLPLCLLFYLLANSIKSKNFILLFFSLVFYAWGEPVWIILMLLTGTFIYLAGLGIDKNRHNKAKMRFFLSLTIFVALSSLAVFKYSSFLIANLNLLPFFSLKTPRLTLPIGISFYTFQALTYAIDLYRAETKVQKSLSKFLLYLSLFPQLIAGPIVRYADVAEQIDLRESTFSDFSLGISRFLLGLGKKVLIANHAGEIVSYTIGSRLSQLSTVESWLGIIAFSLQIYFDFSGYSDMAIGLGRMFGFTFKENFDHPYSAISITDFWRRWHISLSSFFRDYLYIPLGGNRKWQIRNMFIVWCLTGLWHGASWNFVLWGFYYFLFLTIEKLFLSKLLAKIPRLFSHLYTLLIVVLGWVFFYFESISEINLMFKNLFSLSKNGLVNVRSEILLRNEAVFLILAIILSTPLLIRLRGKIKELSFAHSYSPIYTVIVIGINIFILFLSTAALAGSSFNPFLYFRF